MEPESMIDEITKSVEIFRILSVGRSDVGKSSLINRVFGITDAIRGSHARRMRGSRLLHYPPLVHAEVRDIHFPTSTNAHHQIDTQHRA
ncbi:hypothetical protein D9756_006982 [Leucocoprinus leucothites]|uniref:G domain-containing protein n=1 Tax=Leucocoprinus leucothites TaxID=201217 RepID=A0A8H5FYK9_9AGAR|nr:hypothetical protein D9756_006982 [Leucoagaricus leucothites]